MAAEDRDTPFQEEIAEIENRRGKRNLFLGVAGVSGVILLLIIVIGLRERGRLAEEANRPQAEPVEVGELVGVIGSTAVFAVDGTLYYIENIREGTAIDAGTRFARQISYDGLGRPDSAPSGTTYWSIVRADSAPYLIEPVVHPLTGVNPAEYRELRLGAMMPEDYRSAGPSDWRQLEVEQTPVAVSGRAVREGDTALLVDEPSRVRLQGIEGLSTIDSLEFEWASRTGAPMVGYGRILNTPPGGDPLFVLMLSTVHPPAPAAAAAPADAPPAPADTAPPASP
ncbi:MAG TPA: hypothetical protein VM778_00030 [Gemmatimonadota bacterium]|nr:hypothetical protein [Gemmatimonadota bacterium]